MAQEEVQSAEPRKPGQGFEFKIRWDAPQHRRDRNRNRDDAPQNQSVAPSHQSADSPASLAICLRDLRARSVADFNCPQAAIISSPRGVRTGEA